MSSPSDYGLPHPEFRQHQLEAIQKYLSIDSGGMLVTEQPTGSGKSATAMAVASQKSVIVLTATKMLQDAYEDEYDASIMKGKTNYKCVHPFYRMVTSSASECTFSKVGMRKCPHYKSCPYMIARNRAMKSNKAVLNYHYYLAMREHWSKPEYLIMDEAHTLHKLVTDYAGCTISHQKQKVWGLPSFPIIEHHAANSLLRLPPPTDLALPWLRTSREIMLKHYYNLENSIKVYQDRGEKPPKKLAKRFKDCYMLGLDLRSTIDALESCMEDWYVRSGLRARWYRGKLCPAFICKPLTARHHFRNYFLGEHVAVAMSATVGNFSAFAHELGVDDYQDLIVPSRFPPEVQPVHVLDCPAMGSKADGAAFSEQADKIAEAILDCPSEWSGLVLVTRKTEAKLLADRLARRGLQDRVWVTPGADAGVYAPTDKQARAWEERKRKVRNSICLTWAFWTGYDGLDERICIVAKAPFQVWGSENSYEAAWRAYSRKRYTWVAACNLAQGLGRTRRGRGGDYDLNGKRRGLVAIADKSWSQLQSYLPEIVLDSIVK